MPDPIYGGRSITRSGKRHTIIHTEKEATMQNKTVMLFILVLMTLACNLPSSITTATPSPAPRNTNPRRLPSPTPIPVPTQPPTQTPLPADLPFTIDCSALPSRQADCDAYIAATRDQVYPIYREVTGVSLSKCYKEMHYIIQTTPPAPGAGGISAGDTITYMQDYSINLPHRYDVHELLHSISSCTGALDLHVFHGMVKNYVYDQLGVHDPGYFESRSAENLNLVLENQLKQAKTASGQELSNLCLGILMRKTTIVYFDLGGQAVQSLYQGTIQPPETITPNPQVASMWGTHARQVQALLDMLKQKFNYSMNVPECGY